MVSTDGGGGGRPSMTIDSLRADLAETRLLVHDLNKQLEASKTKLEDAESRVVVAATAAAAAAAGRDDGDYDAADEASISKAAYEVQRTQTDTIKRLEKEVNGLNTKTRMLEVHNDLLLEQEKELRSSFDSLLLFGGTFAALLVLFFAAEATGVTDLVGRLVGRRVATWWSEGCDCADAVEAAAAAAASCPAATGT